MPTIGSVTKTIRINPRDLEVIEELMRDGTSWSGAIHKLCGGVPNTESAVSHRLTQYGAAYGLSGEGLATALMDAMDTGEIVYEDGRFRADSEYNFGKFVEACEQKGLDVQKMVDKCAQMIWG